MIIGNMNDGRSHIKTSCQATECTP
jgi:hypothetical protein